MIVDIHAWHLVQYQAWGTYFMQSTAPLPLVADIFKYCAQLDDQQVNVTFLAGKWLISPNHAYLASYFAAKAMQAAQNIAKDLGMETLLYLSGQNQIYNAKRLFGITEGQKSEAKTWVLVILAQSEKSCFECKQSLENFLGSSLETGQNWVALSPMEDIASVLGLTSIYLNVMAEVESEIPQLPVPPSSTQEMGIMQALLERMVALSLSQFKLES